MQCGRSMRLGFSWHYAPKNSMIDCPTCISVFLHGIVKEKELLSVKYKIFKKIAWIRSHLLHLHFSENSNHLREVYLSKTLLGGVNKFIVLKCLLTTFSNVLPLHLKQIFPPIIWIFTEGEGDGIESMLPFETFSTLWKIINHGSIYVQPKVFWHP